MLINWLITFAALMLMIAGWVWVQSLARRTAARHPEAGPFREAGGGCGGGCCGTTPKPKPSGCAGGSCAPCDTPCDH